MWFNSLLDHVTAWFNEGGKAQEAKFTGNTAINEVESLAPMATYNQVRTPTHPEEPSECVIETMILYYKKFYSLGYTAFVNHTGNLELIITLPNITHIKLHHNAITIEFNESQKANQNWFSAFLNIFIHYHNLLEISSASSTFEEQWQKIVLGHPNINMLGVSTMGNTSIHSGNFTLPRNIYTEIFTAFPGTPDNWPHLHSSEILCSVVLMQNQHTYQHSGNVIFLR